jgi:hypothetical protein
MRIVTRALAAAGCAAVSGLVSTTPALAATVTTAETGTLVAKGAVVDVSATYTCDNADQVFVVSVNLTQRTGNVITVGNGSTGGNYLHCDDSLQGTVPVSVYAQGGFRSFKKGTAAARTELYLCDSWDGTYGYNCRSHSGNSIVTLK